MRNLIKVALFLLVGLFTSQSNAQTQSSDVNITVNGKSTLHDWTMTSKVGTSSANFDLSNNQLRLTQVSFTTPYDGLKSDHAAMDNNCYKALKKMPISFVSNTQTITTVSSNTYTIKSVGKLTIAGVTKDVTITSTCKINSDKSITITGSYNISMKDYGIEPPSFMFGSVKTGNDVVINFVINFKK